VLVPAVDPAALADPVAVVESVSVVVVPVIAAVVAAVAAAVLPVESLGAGPAGGGGKLALPTLPLLLD